MRHPFSRAARARRPLRSSAVAAEVQGLEPKQLLTTYTVDSLADATPAELAVPDGELTLREALIAADTNAAFGDAAPGMVGSADRIVFAPSLQGGTLTLTAGELTTAGGVTIDGRAAFDDIGMQVSAGDITIDAARRSRVLNLEQTTVDPLSLFGLTLTGGSDRDGGGGVRLAGAGDARLVGVTVEGNTAPGLAGGGVLVDGLLVNLVDSVVRDNDTPGVGGGVALLDGRLFLNGGLVEGNSSATDGGGVAVLGGRMDIRRGGVVRGNTTGDGAGFGDGGGVLVEGEGVLVFADGAVDQNTAGGRGGGIFARRDTDVRLEEGAALTGNRADGLRRGDGGGGLFSQGAGVRIDGALVTGNSATGPAAGGGGIYAAGGRAIILEADITGNTAAGADAANAGGGGVEVTAGGYVFMRGGRLGSVEAPNTAAAGVGGGLRVSAETVDSPAGRATLRGVVVAGNSAASGGGLAVEGRGAGLRLIGVDAENNAATGAADSQGGGGLFNGGGVLFATGGEVERNDAAAAGGGVFAVEGLTSLGGVRVQRNDAAAGGGAAVRGGRFVMVDGQLGGARTTLGNTAGRGGGLFTDGGEVVLTRTDVRLNRGGEGGGIAAEGDADVRIAFAEVLDNTAGNGGAAFLGGGRLLARDTRFAGNTASADGGTVAAEGAAVTFLRSTVDDSTAAGDGGAVRLADASLIVSDSVFGGAGFNRAGFPGPGLGGGGHVFAEGASSVNAIRSEFTRGIADGDGGAFRVGAGGSLRLNRDSEVRGNEAGGSGGGVYNEGTALLAGGFVTLNAADADGDGLGSGGGLFAAAGSTSRVNFPRLSNNTPDDVDGTGQVN